MLRPPFGAVDEQGKLHRVRRISSRTTDRALAAQKAATLSARLNAGAAPAKDLTFLEVMERHIAYREANGKTSKSTITNYRYARRSLAPFLGNLRGSELTEATIILARDQLERTLKPNTLIVRFNCAAHAWKWAYRREYVTAPWPKGIERPLAEPTDKRPYKEQEIQQILDWLEEHLDGRWLPFFTVLADSGCRVHELCQLRGRDVDREGARFFVARAKSGKPREFSLPPETMALVPEAVGDERVFKPIRPYYRDRLLRSRVVLQVLRRAFKALEFPDAHLLDVHSFRRRWISRSLRTGTPLPVSMKQTGHRSTKVHLDYQARTVDDDTQDAVRRLRASRLAHRASSGVSLPEEGEPPNSRKTAPLSLAQTFC